MRADVIGAKGRIGRANAMSIGSSGRLSPLAFIGVIIRDFVNAFLQGDYGILKIFEAVAEMDRVFTGNAEM